MKINTWYYNKGKNGRTEHFLYVQNVNPVSGIYLLKSKNASFKDSWFKSIGRPIYLDYDELTPESERLLKKVKSKIV